MCGLVSGTLVNGRVSEWQPQAYPRLTVTDINPWFTDVKSIVYFFLHCEVSSNSPEIRCHNPTVSLFEVAVSFNNLISFLAVKILSLFNTFYVIVLKSVKTTIGFPETMHWRTYDGGQPLLISFELKFSIWILFDSILSLVFSIFWFISLWLWLLYA